MKQSAPNRLTFADAILASLSPAEPAYTDFSTPRLREHFESFLEHVNALAGLSPDQWTAFVTLAQRQIAEYLDIKHALTVRAARKAVTKDGPARWRYYDRRIAKIRTATEELVRRAQLDRIIRPDDAKRLRADVAAILGDSEMLAKGRTLITRQRALLAADPPAANFKARMWHTLFEFLVTECGLPKNEAQVRVATIGRRILAQRVTFTARYERGTLRWKGSDAVRKATARVRRAATDTSAKNR